jgi:hypothetical protein
MYNNTRYIGNGGSATMNYSPVNFNTLTLNKPYIFAYRLNASSTTVYGSEWLNGIAQYSNTAQGGSYSDTGTMIQIGTRSDKATSFTGYMGEVIVYSTVLTDSQVSVINSYLSNKWSIT